MENFYFKNKIDNLLMVVNKVKSFDKRFKGDFELDINNLTKDKKSNNYIFTGCQIINRNLFSNLKKKIFPISMIWDKLIIDKCLHGYESKIKFKHITDIKIYKKLTSK